MPDPTPEEMIAAKFAGLPAPEPTPEPESTETVEPETPVETVAEPEPELEASEPEPEPAPEPLLAGKYKTVEELERAYTEAQSAIGRQGNELSELRGLREQFDELRQDLTKPAAPQYDPTGIEDELLSQPHLIPQFAQQALDSGDQVLYGKSIAAWHQVDPGGATAFQVNAHLAAQQAAFDARLAPIQQSVQSAQTATELASVYEQKAAEHADFSQVMNSVTGEQLAGFPKELVGLLQTGDETTKANVLETLYRFAKVEQVGSIADATAAAQAATQADAAQARQDAVVATTTSTTDRTPVVKTPIDQFHDAFQASTAFRKAAGLA